MPDNTLTFESARGTPQQENAVTETVNTGSFPTAFSTNTYLNAQNDVMVVIDTTLSATRAHVITALDRIMKGIMQSTNFTG